MDPGFESWKDVLEVLVMPLTVLAIGVWLPRLFEAEKARKFTALIKRELAEMEPWPKKAIEDAKWTDHLDKRFIHEEIFNNVSDNRDFILSLPPDIAYNTAQLWIHFHKAAGSQRAGSEKDQAARDDPEIREDLAEHGAFWCDYLRGLSSFFQRRGSDDLLDDVYKPWARLVLEYYPELGTTGRLKMEDKK